MANDKRYITLTEENFQKEVLESNQPVLVDFWATWCGPCLVLGPVVEELAGELAGQAKVGKLNVDENPGIASQYGIRSIPTVLIFDKGKLADSTIGVVPKETLRDKINGLVSAA